MEHNAIRMTGVSKVYEQWQRGARGSDILRNLIKPEKRQIRALSSVSLAVERGEFVAYAGANGAGKSTTMKLLAGMLLPTAGEIEVLGLSPAKDRVDLMRRVGVLFGNRTELWWDHPIESSFEWKRVVWGVPEPVFQRMKDMVVELLDLSGLLKTFARELSLGQRMRADLALMLLHNPELILLDEPTLGLDVVAKRQMIRFLKELNREENVTVVVTSHDMDDLEEMARRIILVSAGELAFDGSFDALRRETGNVCRVIITDGLSAPPSLFSAKWLQTTAGMHEFEVNTAQVAMQELLMEIAGLPAVTDIEIRKAPIEQIIAGLYQEWQNGALKAGSS